MSGNMSLQSDVNLVPYRRCDYEHYLHDIFFPMYLFLQCFFSSSKMTEESNNFPAKKWSYLVFCLWLRVYFSFHFKVRKSYINLNIICKICNSVAFVIKHVFWLFYCFSLSSASSSAYVMRSTICFCLIAVKYHNTNIVIYFLALK